MNVETAGHPRASRRGHLKYWKTVAMTTVVAGVCFGSSVGDVMYVNRVTLQIRSGKMGFDKVLATAVQGQPLSVMAVDGPWLKVRYAPDAAGGIAATPTEGWVYEQSLSARDVAAATTAPSGSAAQIAGAGATKNILSADRYAQAKGLNEDAFYKFVLDSHGSIQDQDQTFDRFTAEGHIGPHKTGGATTEPATPSIQ